MQVIENVDFEAMSGSFRKVKDKTTKSNEDARGGGIYHAKMMDYPRSFAALHMFDCLESTVSTGKTSTGVIDSCPIAVNHEYKCSRPYSSV